jgi:hypothetical protein
MQSTLVRFVAGCDNLFEMLVLRLDHFIGGLASEGEIALSTQLSARHGFHVYLFVRAYRLSVGSGLYDGDEVAGGVAHGKASQNPHGHNGH